MHEVKFVGDSCAMSDFVMQVGGTELEVSYAYVEDGGEGIFLREGEAFDDVGGDRFRCFVGHHSCYLCKDWNYSLHNLDESIALKAHLRVLHRVHAYIVGSW